MNSSISSPYPLQRGIALCSAQAAMLLMSSNANERISTICILCLTAMGKAPGRLLTMKSDKKTSVKIVTRVGPYVVKNSVNIIIKTPFD